MTLLRAENHSDNLDRASELEEQFRSGRIRETQALVKQKQQPLADGTYEITDCTECGDEIGEGRLKAAPNNLICIHCATLAERHGRI